MAPGIPTQEIITNKASAIVTNSNSFKGRGSGNPVAKSIRVNIYLCPEDGGDSGTTISIATPENGSKMIFNGLSGTSLTLPLLDR